ncbi:UNVERIFIED_CONTAM: hypothetical protein RMT77_001360 [Armadillidium vulgare]
MGNLIGKSSKITRLVDDENVGKCKLSQKRHWLECATFSDLPPEGKEALLKFTRDRNYITDTRRLEFWFASPDDASLAPMLNKYVNDGEDQLPEVQESDDTDDIIQHAEVVDAYVTKLKDRMRPRLNDIFKKFKQSVAEEIRSQEL